MSDEENNSRSGSPEDAWQDVAEQFRILGKSLAGAVRTAWDDENNQRRIEQIHSGFESMFAELDGAIKDTAESPEAQRFRAEAKESFRSLKDTGEKAAEELRPHLVKVLRQINQELDKAINQMDSDEHAHPDTETTP